MQGGSQRLRDIKNGRGVPYSYYIAEVCIKDPGSLCLASMHSHALRWKARNYVAVSKTRGPHFGSP